MTSQADRSMEPIAADMAVIVTAKAAAAEASPAEFLNGARIAMTT